MTVTSISRRNARGTILAILTLILAACGGAAPAAVSAPAPTTSGEADTGLVAGAVREVIDLAH